MEDPSDPDNPLQLFTTESLIEELLNRFDHVIVAGLQCRTDERAVKVLRWSGNSMACTGLGTMAAHRILTVLDETEIRLEPGEL